MRSILFLCHRLPWPPAKGDKIRSYHVLRRLAERHRVYLGTFIDDPADWRWQGEVEAICASTCIRPLGKWQGRVRALGALARGEALTLGLYRDRVLQRWVDGLVATRAVDTVLCYSSGVAPLVLRHAGLRRVMDFVDVDSDKWRQYAEARHGPARGIFRREARRLAAFEQRVALAFDASVLVSDAEAAFFRALAPAAAGKVYGIANGVDGDYWNPARAYANPYPAGARALVFAGAMDYRANVDAVVWFAHAAWPRVRERHRDARFYIVGAHPTDAVRALGQVAGITVTGRVEDVRPYVAHAHAVAAPLRIARGIQNKVLEALAMAKPVLATPEAWEGIGDFAGRLGCISREPDTLAEEAVRWLELAEPATAPMARATVQARFDWQRNLDAYEAVLEGSNEESPARAPTPLDSRLRGNDEQNPRRTEEGPVQSGPPLDSRLRGNDEQNHYTVEDGVAQPDAPPDALPRRNDEQEQVLCGDSSAAHKATEDYSSFPRRRESSDPSGARQKAPDDSPHPRLAPGAAGSADVRFGVLPAQSRLRGNDGQEPAHRRSGEARP
ncbi:MAG TPA: TIGR03087 family PEP-CTERM/XrtA system glycosyltransferase [Rhodanobacteraceae bacterium]|nr:TIGR03087 family PEP-CTERM/XrtA system glycosyltransferase [Rhodanobacteraceae bacterium]